MTVALVVVVVGAAVCLVRLILRPNIADVAEGVAVPYRAREIAALGNAMAEVGNALQGAMINSIPGDFITPPIFTTKQP